MKKKINRFDHVIVELCVCLEFKGQEQILYGGGE